MTLTDDQIRWARKLLWHSLQKNLKDTLVQPHLDESEHPLSHAKKNWYYRFADEEMTAYPYLREIEFDGIPHPPRTKIATIYRLDRMVPPDAWDWDCF